MILDKELYDKSGVWTKIPCVCDYCGKSFYRSKRNLKVGHTIIEKDSCNSKECVKKKRTESQRIKYGVDNAGGTSESLQKARETWLANWGQENPMKVKSIKDKIKKTCQTKYGKSSFLATDECRESLRQHCLDKYGVENPAQAEEIKAKMRETCYVRYGVSHPRKYEKFQMEFCKAFLAKHGVCFPSQMPDHLSKRKKTCVEKYGFDHPVKNTDIQAKIRETCLQKYGKYPVNCFGQTEQEISSFISSLGFICKSDRKLLCGKEVDIYVPEKHIGIEYCGLFWHNEMSPTPRDRNYHYDKYQSLHKQNIRLVTIFEDEWIHKRQICQSVLSSILGVFEKRLYARNCNVADVEPKLARLFLNTHHLQGATQFQYACGLWYKGELVLCATFGRHHRQNQNGLVISRFCSATGVQVVGGVSKLFSYIRKKFDTKLITWSDNRWSEGGVYEKLGFSLEKELPPDYSYYKYGSYGQRRSKQSMKKSNTGCPKDKTEKEWCLENGYVRIWDCGKKRWTWDYR